ncbi:MULTISPECIES: helix-turn-helix transcriptional regulator [unclassified Oceanispirochaeta]|uniref:helix-turn-helix transcriptional regulator n=1 Tax=unclassified Oceanispirochaeta TaxID=2635722 RepID=UPI000E09A381|nr:MULTISPECIES: helix-turn-helix transcriptional regulator [unclassified Oceanispirochaeta]RDG30885.1 LuxR family transcriptional regulator [Oceanispirochaeta sp. M1]
MIKENFSVKRTLSIFSSITGLGIVMMNTILFLFFRGLCLNEIDFNPSVLYLFIFLIVLFTGMGFLILAVLFVYKKEIRILKDNIQDKTEQIRSLEQKISMKKQVIDLDNFSITSMETNVVRELCLQPNLTNKEIGNNLDLKTGTVKQYMSKIFKKLAINSREELVDRCKFNFRN